MTNTKKMKKETIAIAIVGLALAGSLVYASNKKSQQCILYDGKNNPVQCDINNLSTKCLSILLYKLTK